ncbi:hypothetical protein Dimus_020790 [Dionaea muscipula]
MPKMGKVLKDLAKSEEDNQLVEVLSKFNMLVEAQRDMEDNKLVEARRVRLSHRNRI